MGDGRILFLCPDETKPCGGVRIIYRHVDLLSAAGFDAQVLHYAQGVRVDWFEHATRVTHLPSVSKDFSRKDILVIPELQPKEVFEVAPLPRKVVFNQNAYYTFRNHPPRSPEKRTLYNHPDVLCAIVESEDSRKYLQWVFPKLTVHRVTLSIDPKLFHAGDRKGKIISLMPRKQGDDARQVVNILKHRGALDGWKLRVIDKRPEVEAAAMLRQSMVFLSFGHPEGFGLPAAEAMACGCVVIGYHGYGGREFFTSEHGFPIDMGDVLAYAMRVEDVLRRLNADAGAFAEMTRRASDFIHLTYSPEREAARTTG